MRIEGRSNMCMEITNVGGGGGGGDIHRIRGLE